MSGAIFLQSHIFLCPAKRHWVILDVNRDKYLCVQRRLLEALGPRLQGWEGGAGAEARNAAVPAEEALALANQLMSLGILSEHSEGAKDARAVVYPRPTEALDLDLPRRQRRLPGIHAPAFFASSMRASRQLGTRRFQSIVESVRERKACHAGRAGPFDLARARSLVAVFERWRLFYPRSYLCLFDSLALIHFLARFHVYPDWVFGVAAEPFEAHCWVQAGNVVLNDTVERVSAFTPIMHV